MGGMHWRILMGASAVVLAGAAAAQPSAPPPVCQDNPEYHAFDFWVGEWEVFSTDGTNTRLGTSSIQKRASGCLVLEHWTNRFGLEGFSVNSYDPVDKVWRQSWVGVAGSTVYTGNPDAAGRMVMTGNAHAFANGTAIPVRGLWTPHADGTVTQHFDSQNPATGEWKATFEGLYKPAVTPPADE
jgi:hypothetical protein